MSIRIHSYQYERDFERVGQFLIEVYQHGDHLPVWLQPRWEYMHFHTHIKSLDTSKFVIAEEGDQIMGVVHCEGREHLIYFQVRPGCEEVKPLLFAHAEAHFEGAERQAGRLRTLHIDERDQTMALLAQEHDYTLNAEYREEHSQYDLRTPLLTPSLPEGFRLQSLADNNDLHKINQVLWRGFNHPGPADPAEVAGRRFAQQAPNFRKDLTMVAVAPNGDYVSFGGMWYVPQNKVAYVEPVATDPDYRQMGLGRAVVVESMRRAAALGAEIVWVGSGQEFYLSFGFKKLCSTDVWERYD